MGNERTIDAMASDAVRASEREVFADVMGSGGDSDIPDTVDRSLEGLGDGLGGRHDEEDEDDQHGAEQSEEAQPQAEQPKPEGQQPAPVKGETAAERGLRGELTGERDKRKAAEAELVNVRAEMDRRFAAFEQQLRQAQAMSQRAPEAKPEPVKEEIPDRWSDPDGYDRWREGKILERIAQQQQERDARAMTFSFEQAEAKHGDDFRKAYAAIDALNPADPQAQRVRAYVLTSPNPGEALMSVFRQSEARRAIGNDPDAFRKRVEAEAREALSKDPEFHRQVLEAARASAQQPGAPQPRTQLPPSLSSARGGSASRANSGGVSDAELFEDLYAR